MRPIVLFDEATSALDPENEDHVAESIRRLAHGSTVIVIAHKLSTVTAADNIVVLSADGTVQDSGTHADLMARAVSTPISGRNACPQPGGRWRGHAEPPPQDRG